jgi:hypothetical protein
MIATLFASFCMYSRVHCCAIAVAAVNALNDYNSCMHPRTDYYDTAAVALKALSGH